MRRFAILQGVLVAVCGFPLDPSLDIIQYAHTRWTVRNGFSPSTIFALAQTPTYNLITKAGMRGDRQERFDSSPGRFENIQAQGGHALVNDLKFTHLTTNDGLSQGYVTAILQDRRGFMWFATRDGLNRYDGNTFVVYKNNPNDPGSLSSNFIQDLIEDDHGYLWIATNTGREQIRSHDRTLYPLPS